MVVVFVVVRGCRWLSLVVFVIGDVVGVCCWHGCCCCCVCACVCCLGSVVVLLVCVRVCVAV